MFRLRDHIISLVAVFLALGLGILIGTGFSEDMLVAQQRLLIDQMTDDFRIMARERTEMEAQIQKLSRDLYLWDKYQEALYPLLVPGRLEDQRIAVVSHGTQQPREIISFLTDAGADISSLVQIDSKDKLQSNMDGCGQALVNLIMKAAGEEEAVDPACSLLQNGVVSIEEISGQKPNSVLFVLGERENTDTGLIKEMSDALSLQTDFLIGLEESQVKDSVLDELKAAGASTIDNIDTVFGRFSLLCILQGNPGHYGIKESADEFIATFAGGSL